VQSRSWLGEVLTPLGAAVHMPVSSVAFDVCWEWRLLNSGRGAMDPTDPMQWFEQDELEAAPTGIVAELLASGKQMGPSRT
jgi:hypothetical protein